MSARENKVVSTQKMDKSPIRFVKNLNDLKKAKPQRAKSDDPFKVILGGVMEGVYAPSSGGGWKRLCSAMKPLGTTVDSDGSNPAIRVKFRNRLGSIRAIEIPEHLFVAPKILLEFLLKEGLDMGNGLSDSHAMAIDLYLRSNVPDEIHIRVKGDGWLILPNGSHGFVLGDVLYCNGTQYKIVRVVKKSYGHRNKGDLKMWLNLTQAIDDDRLAVMMVSAGFASSLLHLLNRDATFLCLIGSSGLGKTVILRLVSAIFSAPDNMVTWVGTENGVEAASKKFQHQPFVIDEMSKGYAQIIGAAAYRLTNASGKLRSDSKGNYMENLRNFSVVLSAGEESPIAMMKAAGTEVQDGQRARLITVPVTEEHGVWSNTKGYTDGADKSKRLNAALSLCHGVAAAPFCKLIVERQAQLQDDYNTRAPKLRAYIAAKLEIKDGVIDRVLENFVLFAFAGMLAVDAKVVGWNKNQVADSMRHGFALWYAEHNKSRPVTGNQIMNQLRLFFQSERGTKFKPFDEFGIPSAGEIAGHEHLMRKGVPVFLVFPAYFENKICDGLNLEAVIKELSDRGLLITGARGTPTKQVHVPGAINKNVSFYVIPQSILSQ